MTERALPKGYEAQCLAVAENLKVIEENIAKAAEKSGRQAQDITLLAATKTVAAPVINFAIEQGISHIGENRVQELLSKYEDLALQGCFCEFIGQLQTNKVNKLMDRVDRIQSVDSVKLAREISKQAGKSQRTMEIFLEVNIGREENKGGILPEALWETAEEIVTLPNLHLTGLMAIPPICEKEAELEGYFANMYQSFIDIQSKKLDNSSMEFLSMGMSGDYATAIACGANVVRIGSSLFGRRQYP